VGFGLFVVGDFCGGLGGVRMGDLASGSFFVGFFRCVFRGNVLIVYSGDWGCLFILSRRLLLELGALFLDFISLWGGDLSDPDDAFLES
jgi:hypothetical protein